MINIRSRNSEEQKRLKSRLQVKTELCLSIGEKKIVSRQPKIDIQTSNWRRTGGEQAANKRSTSGERFKYSGVKRPSRPGSKSSCKREELHSSRCKRCRRSSGVIEDGASRQASEQRTESGTARHGTTRHDTTKHKHKSDRGRVAGPVTGVSRGRCIRSERAGKRTGENRRKTNRYIYMIKKRNDSAADSAISRRNGGTRIAALTVQRVRERARRVLDHGENVSERQRTSANGNKRQRRVEAVEKNW